MNEIIEMNDCKVKIIPLGGLEQIGMNMTAIEYDDTIIIMDCGLAFPSDDMLGIDLVIPDVTYLTDNIDKVKGFVITHGHEDHIGALLAFEDMGYNDIVTVESIIWNLPSDEMYDDLSDASSYPPKLTSYRNTVNEFVKKGTTLYKAHPGQIYHMRNVDLQILFTPEQRADQNVGNFNSLSVVTRVVVKDASGQQVDTVMITGDMYGVVGTELANTYGTTMHCNIVQMPHHGWYKHDTGVFWQKVQANYIVWPCAEEKPTIEDKHGHITAWSQNYGTWVKKNLLNNDINSDKCFWAMNDTVVFTLPFTGKNFTRTENTVYPH